MIVVTTPTGDIGSQVLSGLLEHGEAVRLIVRDAGKLSANVRDRVEVIEGSHSEPKVIAEALSCADALFWLVPANIRAASADAAYVDFARAACDLLRDSSIKHVVGISALGRGWPKDAGHVTATLKMDDAIARTGVHYRALTCASLMENVLRQAVGIRDQGAFYWTTPIDALEPWCATRDVATVAVELLVNREWEGVAELAMLGPEDICFRDMMRTMSDVLERQIEYRQISSQDIFNMMLKRGSSEGMAKSMANMMAEKNEGLDHLVARTDAKLNPTTFQKWCVEVLKPATARKD